MRMGMEARMTLPRCVVLAVVFLATGVKLAMSAQTQIVLQSLDTAEGTIALEEIYKVEEALETVSGGVYLVDGHDVGSGTVNVFLYADDAKVDAAIALVVRFFEQGRLPKRMRVGRAVYQ